MIINNKPLEKVNQRKNKILTSKNTPLNRKVIIEKLDVSNNELALRYLELQNHIYNLQYVYAAKFHARFHG